MCDLFSPIFLGVDDSFQTTVAIATFRKRKFEIKELWQAPLIKDSSPYFPITWDQKNYFITSAFDSKNILTRPCEIPALNDSLKIRAAIEFQAESQILQPVQEMLVGYTLQSKNRKIHSYSLYFALKEEIQSHLKSLKIKEIDPHVVSCHPHALVQLHKYLTVLKRSRLYIYLGYSSSEFVLVNQTKLCEYKVIPFGLIHLIQALSSDLKCDFTQAYTELLHTIDFQNLSSKKHPELQKSITHFKDETQRLLHHIVRLVNEPQNLDFAFLGPGSLLPHIETTLLKNGFEEIAIASYDNQLSLSSMDIKKFGIAIGLAATGLCKENLRPQFRVKECTHPKPLQPLKKKILFFSLCCLISSILILQAGHMQQKRLTKRLKEKVISIASLQQTIEQTSAPTFAALDALTPTALLLQLQKKMQDQPQPPYPLFPKTVTVSELLNWLASHPCVIDSDNQALLTFSRIDFHMKQRPSKKNLNEPYRIHVELEYTAQQPKFAHNFYQALLNDPHMVSHKEELQWNEKNGSYYLSFFLKDKNGLKGS